MDYNYNTKWTEPYKMCLRSEKWQQHSVQPWFSHKHPRSTGGTVRARDQASFRSMAGVGVGGRGGGGGEGGDNSDGRMEGGQEEKIKEGLIVA